MTISRVVVAYDGSEAAGAAGRWASSLAEGIGAHLLALAIQETLPRGVPPAVADDIRGGLGPTRRRQWREQVGDDPARMLTGEGPVGPRLLEIAANHRAGLLVVGTASAAPGRRRWSGGTATYLAHHAEMPLAIVPDGTHGGVPARVMVGLDGSYAAQRAGELAFELAARLGSKILAAHVVVPPVELVARLDRETWEEDARRELDGWVECLGGGIEVETVVGRAANPAGELLRAAAVWDAGLVVIGGRGLGGFTGMRLGGTTMAIVHHLDRPLLIVPVA